MFHELPFGQWYLNQNVLIDSCHWHSIYTLHKFGMIETIFLIAIVAIEIVVFQFRSNVSCVASIDKHVFAKGAERQTINGYDYCAYTGIPYARPPVGEYRFEVNSLRLVNGVMNKCFSTLENFSFNWCPGICEILNCTVLYGTCVVHLNIIRTISTKDLDSDLKFWIHFFTML